GFGVTRGGPLPRTPLDLPLRTTGGRSAADGPFPLAYRNPRSPASGPWCSTPGAGFARASGGVYGGLPRPLILTTGSVVDPGGLERHSLKLLGQLQRSPGGVPRRLLGRGRGRVPEEQPATQVVVVPLVRLDGVPVEPRGRRVASRLAELDELPVLHDRDGLPGELAGGHPLDRRGQRVQVLEQRPVALGQGIEPA